MGVECFVTGGSGFVGQHLLARLTATGHRAWGQRGVFRQAAGRKEEMLLLA